MLGYILKLLKNDSGRLRVFFMLLNLRFERSEKRVLSFLDIRVTSLIYPEWS